MDYSHIDFNSYAWSVSWMVTAIVLAGYILVDKVKRTFKK